MRTRTPTTDVYSMYNQNFQKYFENISKITPQYFQSITHLQEEYLKECEKTINTSVFVQQESAKKIGILTDIPSAAKNVTIETKNHLRTLYLMVLEQSQKLKKHKLSQYFHNQFSSLPKNNLKFIQSRMKNKKREKMALNMPFFVRNYD